MIKKILNNDLSTINSGDVAVIFTASWCQSCHQLLSHIEPLSSVLEDKVFEVDVDENEELADKYQIKTLPCTLIINHEVAKERFENNIKFPELMTRFAAL